MQAVSACYSPNSIWLVSTRLDTFDVSSQSSSSCRACWAVLFDTSKMHGLDTSIMSCRDVTWRASGIWAYVAVSLSCAHCTNWGYLTWGRSVYAYSSASRDRTSETTQTDDRASPEDNEIVLSWSIFDRTRQSVRMLVLYTLKWINRLGMCATGQVPLLVYYVLGCFLRYKYTCVSVEILRFQSQSFAQIRAMSSQ